MPIKAPPIIDIAIIGGGAAGLMAAIQAKQAAPAASVVIVEKNQRVGKKLLASGNGRCNLTNLSANSSYYGGNDQAAIQHILDCFSVEQTLAFFESIGLFCREENEGRVYPRNGQASAVLDCLRIRADYLGITTICDTTIKKITAVDDGFQLEGSAASFFARRVIVTGGGKAAPHTGSDGSILALLAALGQPIAPVFPALAPIPVQESFIKALKGVRALGKVTLLADDQPLFSEEGEIQFTEEGLSGICVFNLSREVGEFYTLHSVQGKKCSLLAISIDLLPELSAEALLTRLQTLRQNQAQLPLEQFLTGMLHKRIAGQLLKSCGIAPLTAPVSSLTAAMLERICLAIKDWRFVPAAAGRFSDAQTTAGGALLSGFDLDTLQSKNLPGLFAAGEVLDADGRCGGFNLQWAWSSGKVAGRGAAASLSAEKE